MSSSTHQHTFRNVRDEQGRTVYIECDGNGCTRRMSPREFADQEPAMPAPSGAPIRVGSAADI